MPLPCKFLYMHLNWLGTLGFIFIRCFSLFFSINKLHVWGACCICFWKGSVGSFFKRMWLSGMKVFIFCSSASLWIITVALFLSALAIVRLFLCKMSFICLILCWYLLCRV